ncbi:nucleotidyltransferase family protein [Candidatus Pacearchaeota archaeon]|nr:nucleotidyltransferase family protein [Candidatus Pacearchaeota archaeon]
MILNSALILAGGKGTRFEERTEDLPKPLIPVRGKPILERIIEWLKSNGVTNIIIGVAYKKEMIMNYFGDGSDFGVRINYVEHSQEGGTEDAFKTDIEQVFEKGLINEENFYAMNGDQITDLQLEGLTNAHLRNSPIVTLVSVKLKTNFGVINLNDRSQVIEFKEKGEVHDKMINSGIYVFNKKIKDYLEGENIEENAFRKLIKEGKIYSFYYDGVWLTVNDKNELKKAEEFVKDFDVLNIKNSKNLEFGGSKEKEVIEKIRNVLNELVK